MLVPVAVLASVVLPEDQMMVPLAILVLATPWKVDQMVILVAVLAIP